MAIPPGGWDDFSLSLLLCLSPESPYAPWQKPKKHFKRLNFCLALVRPKLLLLFLCPTTQPSLLLSLCFWIFLTNFFTSLLLMFSPFFLI